MMLTEARLKIYGSEGIRLLESLTARDFKHSDFIPFTFPYQLVRL